MSASLLLAELGLEAFEPALACRLGPEPLQQLALVRYEELLEMGLSKVQCHLFLEKVSSLAAPLGRALIGGPGDSGNTGSFEITDVLDADLAEDVADRVARAEGDGGGVHRAHEVLEDVGASLFGAPAALLPPPSPARRAALRQRQQPALSPLDMPPPATSSSPVLEAHGSVVLCSRKRPHSSHLSNAAARGSEQLSTAGSASGSSSSSLHLETLRVKRRRVRDGRQRSMEPSYSRSHRSGGLASGRSHRSGGPLCTPEASQADRTAFGGDAGTEGEPLCEGEVLAGVVGAGEGGPLGGADEDMQAA